MDEPFRETAWGPMKSNPSFLLPLVAATAALLLAVMPASAQTQNTKQKPGAVSSPSQLKQNQPAPAQKPAAAAAKPNAVPETASPKSPPATSQPTLLGQYDNWGAYWAAPSGRKVCFAAARPQ